MPLYMLGPSDSRSDYESTSSEGNSSSEDDSVREKLEPMYLTTAQLRTRANMFGVTNTEHTQITTTIDPVLYIALYSISDAPFEVDDYHWAFIVGPSHEEADSKGTLYNMEPRQAPEYSRLYGRQWYWMYNQPTVPLRDQCDLLARLMIAEVADMSILQAIIFRWGGMISMRQHVEWMSVRWVKQVLKSLNEDEGCLGRRMESFESVEAEGRWLAETEEKKRKGFCLLDARVSTRTLFEMERATALLSTATVDIAIKYPVLYVAVYKNDRPPHENDEYHWAFLIGPSQETAESEAVRCGAELRMDSNGLPTWSYNQTIVPLCGENDLLARVRIAKIVDLGPLGGIMRDLNATPTTERSNSMARDSEWNSLAWVQEKLEILERKSECFAHKCPFDGMFERVGRGLANGLSKRRRGELLSNEDKTISLISGWEMPDDDATEVLDNLKLARGTPNTMSRVNQFATGVLGATALEMRWRAAEREQRDVRGEQKREVSVEPNASGSTTLLAERAKPQQVNAAKETAENVGRKEATAKPESARATTTDFPVAIASKEANGVMIAANEEEDEGETESDDSDEDASNENKSEEDDSNEDDGDEDGSDEDDGDEDDSDEADSDEDNSEEDDSEEDDSDEDGDGAKGKETTGGTMAHARLEGVRSTTVHFAEIGKPKSPTEGKQTAIEEDEEDDSDESESDEDNDEEDDGEEGDDEEDDEEEDDEEEDDEEEDDEEEEEDGDSQRSSGSKIR